LIPSVTGGTPPPFFIAYICYVVIVTVMPALMVGLTRIHCWKEGDQFRLFDLPKNQAPKMIEELQKQGWKVVHREAL